MWPATLLKTTKPSARETLKELTAVQKDLNTQLHILGEKEVILSNRANHHTENLKELQVRRKGLLEWFATHEDGRQGLDDNDGLIDNAQQEQRSVSELLEVTREAIARIQTELQSNLKQQRELRLRAWEEVRRHIQAEEMPPGLVTYINRVYAAGSAACNDAPIFLTVPDICPDYLIPQQEEIAATQKQLRENYEI